MMAVQSSHRELVPKHWRRPLAALAGLVLLQVVLYWGTLSAMVSIWDRSGTFAHCYLVAPISLWLIWRRRAAIWPMAPQASFLALMPMGLMAMAWLVGDVAGANAVTQFAVTALLVLSVPLVLGWAVARALMFPLLYLFFMVPFGEFLLPWLMEWTADFTVAAIKLSGIPVYREGLQFVIPSGSWSVVEACSGVRYLIASLMVGSLFAYLNYTSMRRRLLFGLVALLVPLVANWLRAYMIVMLGHLSGNKLAVGVDHLIYGWVFFGVVVGIMFLIGARWAEAPVAVPLAAGPVAGDGEPVWRLGLAAALGLCLAGAPQGLLAWQAQGQVRDAQSAPLALPPLVGAPDADARARFVPEMQNPTSTALRSYAVADGIVHVHVAYYRHQGYGRKLVTSTNSIGATEDKAWQLASSGFTVLAKGTGNWTWRRAELLSGSVGASSLRRQRVDARQIYWVDGEFTSSDARATLYSVRGRLAGRGDDAAMVTIYTEGEDATQSAARLQAFVGSHMDAIERQLITYRQRR